MKPTGNRVAAFARTRVNPGVATNPHSGECGNNRAGGLHPPYNDAIGAREV